MLCSGEKKPDAFHTFQPKASTEHSIPTGPHFLCSIILLQTFYPFSIETIANVFFVRDQITTRFLHKFHPSLLQKIAIFDSTK
jgi:hypothetical protein